MNSMTPHDPADVLSRTGRHWGWPMAFGLISLAAGIMALVWPDRTLVVVAVLFGIQLIAAGIFRFVSAFASEDLTGGTRVLFAVIGTLSLIIGLYAVRHVYITVLALALLLGIFWIVSGAAELFTALSYRDMPLRGFNGTVGALSIVAGIVLLVYPAISLLTLAVIVSVWLLMLGFVQIALALRLRGIAHPAHPHPAPAI